MPHVYQVKHETGQAAAEKYEVFCGFLLMRRFLDKEVTRIERVRVNC